MQVLSRMMLFLSWCMFLHAYVCWRLCVLVTVSKRRTSRPWANGATRRHTPTSSSTFSLQHCPQGASGGFKQDARFIHVAREEVDLPTEILEFVKDWVDPILKKVKTANDKVARGKQLEAGEKLPEFLRWLHRGLLYDAAIAQNYFLAPSISYNPSFKVSHLNKFQDRVAKAQENWENAPPVYGEPWAHLMGFSKSLAALPRFLLRSLSTLWPIHS